MPERLESWLADPGLVETVASANATYFDDHVAPVRVGAHILEEVARPIAREAPAGERS